MEWKQEYSVGLLEIDDQHKELLRLFSAVESAIARDGDARDVIAALDNLAESVKYHFWFENGLMRMFGYPGASEHMDKHERMLGALSTIRRSIAKMASYEELKAFLENWLLKHICSTDRSYAQWICSGASAVRSQVDESPGKG